jgi:hypothetical protein
MRVIMTGELAGTIRDDAALRVKTSHSCEHLRRDVYKVVQMVVVSKS